MDLRACVFDVFGTVVDWRGSLLAELPAWGRANGHPGADWTGLVDAWRAAYAPSMQRVRTGELPWTRLDDLHLASLRALAPRFGLPNLDEAALHHLNTAWHRLTPWPDSVPGLTRLRRRFVVGPLSNGNVALLVNMARHAGLPWDTVLGAEVFRHYKPDPETYLGTAALLGLRPEEVMLCAAHNDDLRAARACGLRTAFIRRPTEYGPAQTTDLVPTGPWDHAVNTITELAEALRT